MTRDPLLPVRLVDGVWTTEGAGSAAVPTEHHPGIMALGRGAEWPCSVTLPPRPATDYARAFAEYNPPPRSEIVIPVTMDADEAHRSPSTSSPTVCGRFSPPSPSTGRGCGRSETPKPTPVPSPSSGAKPSEIRSLSATTSPTHRLTPRGPPRWRSSPSQAPPRACVP